MQRDASIGFGWLSFSFQPRDESSTGSGGCGECAALAARFVSCS
jgi:hypothetical protein